MGAKGAHLLDMLWERRTAAWGVMKWGTDSTDWQRRVRFATQKAW